MFNYTVPVLCGSLLFTCALCQHCNKAIIIIIIISQLSSSCSVAVPNFVELSVWPLNSPDLNPVDYAVWGALQQSVYRKSHSSFQPGRSQGQSAYLLGVLTNRSSTVAWQTEGSSSSERWTHWTVVLNIWFIWCHALLCSMSLCVLRTCVRFAIVYRALPWSCDKKSKSNK